MVCIDRRDGRHVDAGAEGVEGGDEAAADIGAEDLGGGVEAADESIRQAENLLMEQKAQLKGKQKARVSRHQKSYMDRLSESIHKDDKPNIVREKIYDKNLIINETVNNMIGDIDDAIEGLGEHVD